MANIELNFVEVTMTETGRNKYFGSKDKRIVGFRIMQKIMELKLEDEKYLNQMNCFEMLIINFSFIGTA